MAVGTLASALFLAAAAPAHLAAPWNVDAAHTEINFSVKHFFTPVTGTFRDFQIDLDYDAANPANSTVNVTIQVASVDTNNEKRDAHLMSGDFFEAETHPTITFRSTSVRAVSADQLMATGDLTIKGVTQQVELPIQVLGIKPIPEEMREMLGGVVEVASFAAGTTIDRGDFGVGTGSWAATLVVGGDVTIGLAVEANRM